MTIHCMTHPKPCASWHALAEGSASQRSSTEDECAPSRRCAVPSLDAAGSASTSKLGEDATELLHVGASDCHFFLIPYLELRFRGPYLCGGFSGVAAVRLGVKVAWAVSASVTTPAALPSRSILSAPATKQPRYTPLRQ